MTLTQELRRIRREKDISQDELSRLVGIDPAQISRYETGKHIPSLPVLEKMGEALGVHLKWEKK